MDDPKDPNVFTDEDDALLKELGIDEDDFDEDDFDEDEDDGA
jgi:hypothetical protein